MCYVFPTVSAIVTSTIWNKTKSVKMWWLSLLFWGGALFGVIDHLWNGELFLISKDWLKDLSLGVVITGVILVTWRMILSLAKRNLTLGAYLVSLERK